MAIKVDGNHVSLSVRDLLTPSSGVQITSSFPLPQRGMLGRQAHTRLQQQKARRYGLFHSEYTIGYQFPYRNFVFHIRGRIDGLYRLKNRAEIEEIKTVILTAKEFKQVQLEHYPQFTEQVLFYAYLLQQELEGMEVGAYLILVNLINDARRTFTVPYHPAVVENRLIHRFDVLIANLKRETLEQQKRSAALNNIDFSLPEIRSQQQEMMTRINLALQNGTHLMVSAPTGTGKTAAALYPAIRYAYTKSRKIFFVTSKTSQQNMVFETLSPLIAQGLDLKIIFLRASQKMCANDIYFCHEAFCPYAKDFRERMLDSNILSRLSDRSLLTADFIFDAAKEEKLCPFEVSLEVALTADIVIGDFNYVFDPAVYLRRLFRRKDYSDWILIIDEAHNLYDRGMQYLSPHITRHRVQTLWEQCSHKKQKVYKQLTFALEQINDLFAKLNLEGEVHYSGRQYFQTQLNVQEWQDARAAFEAAFIKYQIYKIKKRLLFIEDPIENFYYRLRRFVQIAAIQDRAFVPFYDAGEGGILKIQCCDPSAYLAERMDGFHSVLAMSATLDPMPFYKEVLGFSTERTETLQLDSPFPAHHRQIVIVPNISTLYKDRLQSYPKIARVIEEVIRIKEGNYLVFFPSFDFIQHVNLFLGKVRCKKILQNPGMKEAERNAILRELRKNEEPTLLMAVMGGVFSEGVDYSGRMAIGVIIISPAIPQISYERELLRRYYQEKNGMGMEYAYIYPGMNKVIQSVGRLIRSVTDQGVIVLIGQRFAQDHFNSILPEYWFSGKDDVLISADYVPVIRAFWQRMDSTGSETA